MLNSIFSMSRIILLPLLLPLFAVAQEAAISSDAATASDAETISDAQNLEELIKKLDQGIADVKALDVTLETAPERDVEAIKYRRAERSFKMVEELDRLAVLAAKLPEEEPQRLEMVRRLQEDYAAIPDLLFTRIDELGTRIGEFTVEADSLSGTKQLAMEAYVFSLRELRVKSYEAVGNFIASRNALGLATEAILQELAKKLYMHAEVMVGRLQFSGAARDELQDKLNEDPANTDLAAALRAFSSQHSFDLARLGRISELMGKLGLENALYKSVLLQQGQDISIRDIETDMLMDMWADARNNINEFLVDQTPDFLFNVLIFVLVLLLFRMLSRLTRRGVRAACERSPADMSTLLKDVLASVSGGTVMVMGVLIALSQIGISLGPMLAGLGVAGFVVGFALQDTLGNFAAGGMILIYRPYDVDDFVEVAGASGLVKKMSLVSTTITTFDNQTLVVPNSKIWGDVIKNVTAQRIRRVDLEFGIGYGDDIEKAEKVLADVVLGHELVLKKPETMIKLHTLGDSSVNFVVRPWVKTSDYWDVYWDLTREVKMRFDQEGISIPFPQRDVHIYQDQA